MGVENALKASHRERRLRQAIDLIENPAVRQQALARLAATEEQTDRCTLMRRTRQHPRLLRALPSARGPTKRKVRRVQVQRGGGAMAGNGFKITAD